MLGILGIFSILLETILEIREIIKKLSGLLLKFWKLFFFKFWLLLGFTNSRNYNGNSANYLKNSANYLKNSVNYFKNSVNYFKIT